ncbi:MAG: nucleotidyltransferase substrate binding protein [Muribaculaceae bacterium]|nr:nucleotidyltransferase substrate binding protein [Muribaculaceae bacterium]
MCEKDVRWIQRLYNYSKALDRLTEAVVAIENASDIDHLDLLKEGLIQRFEFTHELSWKVLKDYMEYQGIAEIRGSRDAFRQALNSNLISDPSWMDSIQTRNITSHTYDEDITNTIFEEIIKVYYPLMITLRETMNKIKADEHK